MIGILSPVGVLVGVVVANEVPERALRIGFALLAFYMAWRLLQAGLQEGSACRPGRSGDRTAVKNGIRPKGGLHPGRGDPAEGIEVLRPGGQHANVTASRIEAVFDVNASAALTDAQKARVSRKLGPTVTAISQDARSQAWPRPGPGAAGGQARRGAGRAEAS